MQELFESLKQAVGYDPNAIFYCWEVLMVFGVSLLLGGAMGFLFGVMTYKGKIEVTDRIDLHHPKGR